MNLFPLQFFFISNYCNNCSRFLFSACTWVLGFLVAPAPEGWGLQATRCSTGRAVSSFPVNNFIGVDSRFPGICRWGKQIHWALIPALSQEELVWQLCLLLFECNIGGTVHCVKNVLSKLLLVLCLVSDHDGHSAKQSEAVQCVNWTGMTVWIVFTTINMRRCSYQAGKQTQNEQKQENSCIGI